MQPARTKHLHPWGLSLLTLITLVGCTGSFEGSGAATTRLVIANPNTTTIACSNGTATPSVALQAGLFVLDAGISDRGLGNNCQGIPTDTPPYDLVGTPEGDRVIVSLPKSGRLELREYTDLTAVSFTFAPISTTAGGEAFCPTRLSLSPNGLKVVALDDPDDPSARALGCSNSNNRQPRIVVFDLPTVGSTPTLRTPVYAAGQNIFDALRSNGQSSATLTDTQAFVISPFTAYNLYRLTSDGNLDKKSGSLSELLAGPNARAQLSTVGTSLYLAFSDSIGNGGAYTINPNDLNLTPVARPVGNQNQALGATNRIVSNRRSDNTTIAYLQTSSVTFQRLAGAFSPALPSTNAVDATFTPDGYAWLLETSGLRRFDITNLGAMGSGDFLNASGLDARAIAWVNNP